MSLMRTIRSLTDATKIITPRYVQWLDEHGDEPLPTWVVDRIAKILTTKPRNRSGSFSASSSGRCLRAQELTFLGIPPNITRAPSTNLRHIYNDGKWRHLRWQAQLLAAGILDDIEDSVSVPEWHAKGSMDGYGVVPRHHRNSYYRLKEFGFELKGVNGFIYPRYVKDPRPREEHMKQIHRYFVTSGVSLFVVIYENKATSEWHEWVVRPDTGLLEWSRQELEELNSAVDRQTLHDVLPSCKKRFGPTYLNCEFAGKQCLAAKWRKE